MGDEFDRIRSTPTPPEGDSGGGSGTRFRRPAGIPSARLRRKRAALLLAGTMSVFVLLASGSAWAITGWASGQLDRFDVFGALADEERPEAGPRGTLNFLVIGSDAREGMDRDSRVELGVGGGEGARADTMMLVHLNHAHDHVTVVGIPRDSWVAVPGHGQNKINAAYSLGGPSLTVRTVEASTGIRIDHYVEVNFTGFVQVVDALGGIEVCLPEAIHDERAHLSMEAGTHHVDGTEALAFARTRQSPDGDLDRIDRQQQVLAALLDRALSTDTLGDPRKFTAFLDSALGSVAVDESLDTATIRQLGNQLSSLGLDDVTFTQVPIGQMDFWTPHGDVALVWDREESQELFGRIRRDEPIADPAEGDEGAAAPSGQEASVPPEEVTVEVYNGVGTSGLGSEVRSALMNAGFNSPSVAQNWATRDVAETLVRHAPHQQDAAATVVEAIPGARTEVAEDLGDSLQVVIGFNYEGVDPQGGSSGAPEESEGTVGDAGRENLTTSSARDNVCE